jgi:ParB/RepB/Spo0J family partition protein
MTTFATIPLDQVTIHPDNVRRDAAADEELVESIRSQGILQPLGVVEADGQYLLIAGHRRYDGARQAGLTSVPAVVLDHLTTRAQQIEAMLVENGRRVDLTPMEEAKAYEQLTFEGYKPKDIAKATGRAVATVQSRLKLNNLNDDAQTKIHARELSLDDALKLTQLEDHPELLEEVLATVGTNNFDLALRQAFQRIARDAEWEQRRAGFTAKGLTKVEMPDNGWSHTTGPCPHDWRPTLEADAWTESTHSGPILVVTTVPGSDSSTTETPEERKHRESEWEKQQVEREAERAAKAAAQALRVEHLRKILDPAKFSTPVLAVLRLAVTGQVVGWQTDELALFGDVTVTREPNQYGDDWGIAEQVKGLPDKTVSGLVFAPLLADLEGNLERADFTAKAGRAKHALAYYDLLVATGYVLADVETAHRDAVAANLAVLEAHEAEAA